METIKIYEYLRSVIENPYSISDYRGLQKLYLEAGREREARAFGKLVEELRGGPDGAPTGGE